MGMETGEKEVRLGGGLPAWSSSPGIGTERGRSPPPRAEEEPARRAEEQPAAGFQRRSPARTGAPVRPAAC